MKVLIADPLAENGLKLLREEEGIWADEVYNLTPAQLRERIVPYHALIIRSKTRVSEEVIQAAENLKVIARAGVGVDNIDVEAASRRGIIVMNAPDGNIASAAEHTISMILALSRNIPQANASLKARRWEGSRFIGTEVYNKTLGIIGLGRIGSEVAKRAQGLGMKVIAYDPYASLELAGRLKIALVEMSDLLGESDYITIHTPLNETTLNLIDDEEFAIMKDGVRLINCARGEIVNEAALHLAITKGKVAGAALDVFSVEPPFESPLLDLEEVIATPHLGASTHEAQRQVAVDVARQVIDALKGLRISNAVNVPSVEPEVLKVIRPYLNLAEKMGSLETQYSGGHTKEMRMKYTGEVTNYDLAPITHAFLKGLFDPILEGRVNYVNAPIIAKERGIRVNVTKSTQIEDFANLIEASVTTDAGETYVAGTLFGSSRPRIVRINDYHVAAIPDGYMLIVTNLDKPGMMGKIGTLLGSRDVNIADMTLGRVKPGGQAMVVLNLDNPLPPGLLDEINSMENVVGAKMVKF